jgi:hypothetical protein
MNTPTYPPRGPAVAGGRDPRLAGLPDEDAERLYAGARALRDGQPARAEALFEAALARHPDHPEALRRLAFVLMGTNRVPQALERLQRALAHWPDDAVLWTDVGIAHNRLRDHEQAIAAWQRACALDDTQPMPCSTSAARCSCAARPYRRSKRWNARWRWRRPCCPAASSSPMPSPTSAGSTRRRRTTARHWRWRRPAAMRGAA